MWLYRYKKLILVFIGLLMIVAMFYASKINFVFDFERYFPEGDEDLAYFYEFRESFEDDDNFLLIAFTDSISIFNQPLLTKVDSFTRQVQHLDMVSKAQSITNFMYFRAFPLGGFSPPYPAIHINAPDRYRQDSIKLMEDERVHGNLISKDGKATVVLLKTSLMQSFDEAKDLMEQINALLDDLGVKYVHVLGRANFQEALVRQQIRELVINTIIAAALVLAVFWFFLRRPLSVFVALISIIASLIIFLGLVGFLGIEMDLLSSLFPIVMIIVGVSDVVHLMMKYIDAYLKCGNRKEAIKTAVSEIGLAIFLTSFTTAVGFLTLMTSNIYPVRLFGMTAALGVICAFVIIMLTTSSLLAIVSPDHIVNKAEAHGKWYRFLTNVYHKWKGRKKVLLVSSIIYLVLCSIGIYNISTNIQIHETLPKGLKVTDDFKFFEDNFAGYRPIELAINLIHPFKADDFEVLRAVDSLEQFIQSFDDITSVVSITSIYKTLNRASMGDRAEAYTFPSDRKKFEKFKKFVARVPSNEVNVLVNSTNDKLRVAAKVKDIGTERTKNIEERIYSYSQQEINPAMMQVRVTGTGVMFNKNNIHLRRGIFIGLGIAFLIISLLMALLFRNIKMIIVALVPNVFPLLFGGALMGYFKIPLDAPTAIIFAIAFGIAVDDTIHFLSKYKIERMTGADMEEAILATMTQAGKAIIITSIILFFGFLILMFSRTISIVFVGMLISGTLLSAVVADLILIPPLIRHFLKT